MTSTHANHSRFKTINNQLRVGEHSLHQIEQLVGGTPYYAYDKGIISDTIASLKSQLPAQIKCHFAIKANPYPPLVHFISSMVDGFDVASQKELLLALQTQVQPKDISFAGPGKSKQDLTSAIVAGVTLHAESLNEISQAISIGQVHSIKPNIAIRVNPAFELKASGMKMSGGSKPFGIDEEALPEILSNLDYKSINFKGFHIFSGSQNLNAQALIEAHSQTFALAKRLIESTPVPIEYINIGGGLGIPYFPKEIPLDLTTIAENLEELLTDYAGTLNKIEVIMELGRYLVGEAGVYVNKVIDKKSSRGQTYLVCDGGLHHHLANSGNFGQVIRKNYPVSIDTVNQSNIEALEVVNIVGPLCTPLDIIADKVTLPKAALGDYVVVYQSGAYGFSASPKDFLSQPHSFEILL